MMMRYRGICILLCGLFFSASLQAVVITWDEAVARARSLNPTLIKAKQAVESAKLSVGRSYGAFLPALSATAGMSQSQNDTFPVSKQVSVGLSGSLSLFNGFSDISGVRQADDDLKIAQQR